MIKKVVSFEDLEVYQRLYKAALVVHKEVLPKLPQSERFILTDQLSRSTRSPPALLAEGYSRRTRSGKEWKKYIRDAIGECNESIVHLMFIQDLYPDRVDSKLCGTLIEEYRIAAKQLFRLGESWK